MGEKHQYATPFGRAIVTCADFDSDSIGFTVASRFSWGMRGGYFPVVLRHAFSMERGGIYH